MQHKIYQMIAFVDEKQVSNSP